MAITDESVIAAPPMSNVMARSIDISSDWPETRNLTLVRPPRQILIVVYGRLNLGACNRSVLTADGLWAAGRSTCSASRPASADSDGRSGIPHPLWRMSSALALPQRARSLARGADLALTIPTAY
jgi:hypothetical protein